MKIWRFYADGFRSMTVGRQLWALILVKVALLFLVFKHFFFHDLLERDYGSDPERAEAVRSSLLERQQHQQKPLTDTFNR